MMSVTRCDDERLTLTSLKDRASVEKVVFKTEGLFLTLGKMIPPFLDVGFVVV